MYSWVYIPTWGFASALSPPSLKHSQGFFIKENGRVKRKEQETGNFQRKGSDKKHRWKQSKYPSAKRIMWHIQKGQFPQLQSAIRQSNNVFQTMKANRRKNAARKQMQPNRKDVKSMAADNDRIYEKSLQSHPDEDCGFLFNYGRMDI